MTQVNTYTKVYKSKYYGATQKYIFMLRILFVKKSLRN